jgi:peptidoglycan/LPS O-acetylase OafA/YrhL
MLTGIWLFSARRFLRPSNIWGWISTAAAAGIIAFPWLFEAYEYMSGMLVIPLLALLVLSLSFGKGPAASLVSTKPAVLWGEASYSLYMTSSLSHMFFAAALPWKMLVNAGLPVRLATLTLIFAGVAGVTAATYKWVDQPWRKRLRNLRLLDPPAIGPRQAGNAA